MQPVLGWTSEAELAAGVGAGVPSPMVQVEASGATSPTPWTHSMQLQFVGVSWTAAAAPLASVSGQWQHYWPGRAWLIAVSNLETRGCFSNFPRPISHAPDGSVGPGALVGSVSCDCAVKLWAPDEHAEVLGLGDSSSDGEGSGDSEDGGGGQGQDGMQVD